MAISKNIGSTVYFVPQQGSRGWGNDTTNLLARLADVANQVVTAQYVLTTDNFFKDVSGQYGLKANFLKGVGAIASGNGFIRMASPYANPGNGLSYPGGTPEGKSYTYLSWRDSTNSSDLHLYPNNDNLTLQFAGVSQVNVDAAQTLSNKILDNTNQVSGLAITAGTITDAQIAAAAAIALTKLAALTSDRLLVSSGLGVVSPSSVTAIEAGYLSGVTSSIQTQLNTKATFNANITPGTATKITYDLHGFVTAGTTLSASDIPTGIDAIKIGAGTVDNTELGYLDGVTSAIQTQINNKLSLTGGTLTGALTLAADPVGPLQAATKGYVDALSQGISWKQPVRAASTVNLTLSGAQTVDNVSLVAADRILVKNQTTASNNGIYIVSAGAWSRSLDADAFGELNGASVMVLEGTVNGDKGFFQTAELTSLATNQTWIQNFGAGTYNADGTTLTLSGNTFSVAPLGINNTHIATSAAISLTKLAAIAANRATVTDVNGLITASPVTNVELSYLTGVTSAIQTQLDAKIPSAILTTKGDLLTRNATVNTRIAVGTNGQYLKADSTTATGLVWADLAGGGSGSGEKNYIGNPNSATNWVASNAAQLTVTTESTQANLPDNSTQLTGLNFTRISGTAYAYYRFTLDKADYNKKLKIQKDIAYAGSLGDYQIQVFSNTLANYTGTSTSLAVGPTANLPGPFTGQVTMSFDTPGATAPYIEVRVVGAAGTTPIYMNNFLVGPGVIGQVPALGPIAWSPTFPAGWGTPSSMQLSARRVGDRLHLSGRFTAGTVTSNPATIPLPPNLTIAGAQSEFGGKWVRSIGTAGNIKQGVVGWAAGAQSIYLALDDTATAANPFSIPNVNTLVNTGDSVAFDGEISIPIAEWQGSGTVNVGAGAQPSYASNSSTTLLSDSASFQYGEDGALVQAFASAGVNSVSKRVRSPYPNPKYVVLQFKTGNKWINGAEYYGFKTNDAGTAGYGAFINPVAANTTDYDVVFLGSATDPISGHTWSNESVGGTRWRVVFADTPAAVGFGLATATDSGLVSTTTQTFAGDKTFTGNVTANNLLSGTYTPTAAAISNSAGATGMTGTYLRVGNVVHVTIFASLTTGPTIGGLCRTSFTLPIARTTGNFSTATQAMGTSVWGSTPNSSTTPYASGYTLSLTGGQTVDVSFNNTLINTAANFVTTFMYTL